MADDATTIEQLRAELSRCQEHAEAAEAETASLRDAVGQRNRELTEALERQTATAEVLRVIATSPAHLQSVVDALVERVHRLCGADGVTVRQVDGAVMRLITNSG